jgi:hypothetical protein
MSATRVETDTFARLFFPTKQGLKIRQCRDKTGTWQLLAGDGDSFLGREYSSVDRDKHGKHS